MNLSKMTKAELIERVNELQFSLEEAHKVIQHFSRDIPAYRKAKESETRENKIKNTPLSLKQGIEKYDLFNLYDSIVAGNIFDGHDDIEAKEDAFDTVVQVLVDEGVTFKRESLYLYFPEDHKASRIMTK